MVSESRKVEFLLSGKVEKLSGITGNLQESFIKYKILENIKLIVIFTFLCSNLNFSVIYRKVNSLSGNFPMKTFRLFRKPEVRKPTQY